MIGGVLQQGLMGMQQSTQSMNRSAQDIASLGTVPADAISLNDVSEPLINLKQQQQIFDASAKVVSVADETLGALLETSGVLLSPMLVSCSALGVLLKCSWDLLGSPWNFWKPLQSLLGPLGVLLGLS